MKNTDSVIQLEHYFLDQVFFEIKDEAFEENSLDITPKFSIDFEELSARVRLDFYIEEEIFYMRGSLIGVFSYDQNQSEDKIKELLVVNGVTILFPYLRSTISFISHAANVPTIVIPTTNIWEYLQSKYDENVSE